MDGTGTIGKLLEKARPFANPNPTRSPVKEPGPMLIAIASISSNVFLLYPKLF